MLHAYVIAGKRDENLVSETRLLNVKGTYVATVNCLICSCT